MARCEYSCAYLLPIAHTRLRVHRAPGIPHALYFQGGCFWQTSDALRREIAESHLDLQRHCEERSDEAIHSYLLSFLLIHGLLRFARNDGLATTCALAIRNLITVSSTEKYSGLADFLPHDRGGLAHGLELAEGD